MRVRLGDIASVVARQVDPRLPEYASLPLINGENIESGTTRLLFRRTAADEGVISPKYEVAIGDVVYSKLRPYLRKAAVANEPGLCSADSYPLRLDSELADPQWMSWMLVSEQFTRYATDASARARMPKLNREQLFSYEFDLPPVEAQRRLATRVAAQFAAVGDLMRRADARASSVRELRARAVNEPYDRPPSHWPRRSIETVARLQTGYAFRSEWFTGAGIRLLRNANVGHGVIDWTNLALLPKELAPSYTPFRLAEGDIVLSLDRPIIASGIKVARLTAADVPSLLLQRVARIFPGADMDADYLYHFLLTRQFASAISAHDQSLGVPHVSPRQVGSVLLPFPPIAEQRRVAAELRERLAAIDAMERAIRVEQAAIDALPAALLRRAFDGLAA